MYYEEQFINGVLMFRTNPNGKWEPCSNLKRGQRIKELQTEVGLVKIELEHTASIKDPAPSNNLPDWNECSLRVSNTEYVEKRIADGGLGFEEPGLYANEIHKFIYEYDDSNPYKSAWFLHRLEKLIEFVKSEAKNN